MGGHTVKLDIYRIIGQRSRGFLVAIAGMDAQGRIHVGKYPCFTKLPLAEPFSRLLPRSAVNSQFATYFIDQFLQRTAAKTEYVPNRLWPQAYDTDAQEARRTRLKRPKVGPGFFPVAASKPVRCPTTSCATVKAFFFSCSTKAPKE